MAKGIKTNWTPEMDEKIRKEFPVRFTREIANELKLGLRTIIRRARELGVEKEEKFLENRRELISKMAQEARPENPTKGDSTFRIPGGEKYQYKKGHVPAIKNNPEIIAKVQNKRNQTIKRERIRLKYGLKPITKMKLDPYK